MVTEINRIKHNPIFKSENKFFISYKPIFVEQLSTYISQNDICEHTILEPKSISENFYDALFNPKIDFYNMHICWLENADVKITFFLCSLFNSMLKSFLEYKKTDTNTKAIELITIFEILKKNFFTAISERDKITFDISPYMPKEKSISYLHNMYKLDRRIKFIVHNKMGTSHFETYIKQIGQYSAVIKVSNEQLLMIAENNNSFILKENSDEKNFSVKASILCTRKNTAIIKDIKELDDTPLISRKFPRAAIVHASIVHIANEDEYITGNMIDISEGGIGIVSSSKSQFTKGQDIVAFLSYEDPKNGLKFSFESSGIISSIIGKEHAFRYGIQLNLTQEEKTVIHKLVKTLSKSKEI